MKHSMENFFNWIMKPIPDEEVDIWFNVNNMHFEKIELFGDIFKTLDYLINSTYLGGGKGETVIHLTDENNLSHFDWCWSKLIDNFGKEKIFIEKSGEHKDYFLDFYKESFYSFIDNPTNNDINTFLNNIFDLDKPFSKSDLEILTQIYKLLDKNVS